MGYGVKVDVTTATWDFTINQSLKMREIPPIAETVPPLREWYTICGIWR
jgi:hypothetical protein